MPDLRVLGRARLHAWLRRWGQLLPLLIATFIVMMGFGAVIPVLPLFVESHGIDASTLGVIVAGWAIGRLIAEPPAGWWADAHSRKPQMVLSLLIVSATAVLMLLFTSAAALFVLRFIAGIASGMFGPAARGSLVDATDEGARGQAFGYFAAFQMGGFVIGPAIGAFGASLMGGFAFPFLFMSVLGLVAAAYLWRYQPAHPHVVELGHDGDATGSVGPSAVGVSAATEVAFVPTDEEPPTQAPLSALLNPTLLAAVIVGFGLQLTFGIYDVVWPLFLVGLGASIEWVGLTFVLIGIPAMVLAPVVGRYVDRFGPIPFVISACIAMVGAGLLFASAWEPWLPTIVVTIEAGFVGILGTALFAMVASGSPPGRSSLAQGIFGSVGTTAIILSAIMAGALWELDSRYPFYFYAVGVGLSLGLGMLVYTRGFGLLGPRSPASGATP